MLSALLLIPLNALVVAVCASATTKVVLGAWPTAYGMLSLLLLYCVVVPFLTFAATSLTSDGALLGRSEYDVGFFAIFLLTLLWAQTEFLRPSGGARVTFNQAGTIFFVSGIGLYVILHVEKALGLPFPSLPI